MGIKINLGVTKKVGTPNYGSRGASCSAELEIFEGSFDNGGVQRFQEAAQKAYSTCWAAVEAALAKPEGTGMKEDELASESRANTDVQQGGNGQTNGRRQSRAANGERKATASQVRAIHAIASRQRTDLAGLLSDRFEVNRPEDLSIGDASALIDELKAIDGGAANGQKGGANVGRSH